MKISKGSLDLVEERKKALKRLMPEVFTEGKLDPNKLREALGDLVETSGERYTFTWAGKIQSIRMRDKRSKATLVPSKKESVNFDETKNVFIEGENLEVLKILQKAYEGKIKMIYIDPPYNIDADVDYEDDFSDPLKAYLRYTGQINEAGRKTTTDLEKSGRFHSRWLSKMYPRLFLARNLLSEDGAIFVSIDDDEVHNLRIIMNEIFGEENFVAQFPWRKRTAKSDVPFGVSQDYEWILCFAKSSSFVSCIEGTERKYYETPDLPNKPWRIHDMTTQRTAAERPNSNFTIINPKTGDKYPVNPNAVWRVTSDTFKKFYSENRIVFPGDYDFLNISNPVLRYFKDEDEKTSGDMFGFSPVSTNLPKQVGMTQDGTKDIGNLFDNKIFAFPKPVGLLQHLIKIATSIDKSATIIDFFAGSGTTANAVLEQNAKDDGHRKFILVQLPEPTLEDSEARKAGYKTIAEICKERIRRVIKKIKDEQKQHKTGKKQIDLGFKVFKLARSNCFVWDSEEVKDQKTLVEYIGKSAKGASKADSEALVFELMLREGFKLDSEIQHVTQGKNSFYKVSDGEHSLWMCFDEEINDESVKKLSLMKDDKLIVLDSSLSDTQKVNLARKFRVETV